MTEQEQTQAAGGAMLSESDIDRVAEICHEANFAVCRVQGEYPPPVHWDAAAADWQRGSARAAVRYYMEHAPMTADEMHEQWMRHKLEDGWRFGRVKDEKKKEHPCLLPRCYLPPEQRLKDDIFVAICEAYRAAQVEHTATSDPNADEAAPLLGVPHDVLAGSMQRNKILSDVKTAD